MALTFKSLLILLAVIWEKIINTLTFGARGKIDVRSVDVLNEEQYYSFFLNVLEVYGYAGCRNGLWCSKIIKAKDSKTSAIPVAMTVT